MQNKRTESDWKYMRGLKPELLDQLCERINRQTVELLADDAKSPHDIYLAVYRYINDTNEVIAECFDDWRRSTLSIKLLFLRKHGLLTDEHIEHLSAQTAESIRAIESLGSERVAGRLTAGVRFG